MIRTTEDEFFIEPLEKGKQKEEEEGRIHVIYKRSIAKKVMPEDFPNRSGEAKMTLQICKAGFTCYFLYTI